MKAIIVVDIDPRLLNGQYYAEVNIKPKDRSRNWNEQTVEAELIVPKPYEITDFTFNAKKGILQADEIFSQMARVGYNECLEELLGEELDG